MRLPTRLTRDMIRAIRCCPGSRAMARMRLATASRWEAGVGLLDAMPQQNGDRRMAMSHAIASGNPRDKLRHAAASGLAPMSGRLLRRRWGAMAQIRGHRARWNRESKSRGGGARARRLRVGRMQISGGRVRRLQWAARTTNGARRSLHPLLQWAARTTSGGKLQHLPRWAGTPLSGARGQQCRLHRTARTINGASGQGPLTREVVRTINGAREQQPLIRQAARTISGGRQLLWVGAVRSNGARLQEQQHAAWDSQKIRELIHMARPAEGQSLSVSQRGNGSKETGAREALNGKGVDLLINGGRRLRWPGQSNQGAAARLVREVCLVSLSQPRKLASSGAGGT